MTRPAGRSGCLREIQHKDQSRRPALRHGRRLMQRPRNLVTPLATQEKEVPGRCLARFVGLGQKPVRALAAIRDDQAPACAILMKTATGIVRHAFHAQAKGQVRRGVANCLNENGDILAHDVSCGAQQTKCTRGAIDGAGGVGTHVRTKEWFCGQEAKAREGLRRTGR